MNSPEYMGNSPAGLPAQIGNMPLVMTSREIAEVVGSRHDNVKRTMETLAEKGLVRFTQTEETSHEGAGARSVAVYLVDKRDSFVVVARLSPEFTARLVDYWLARESSRPTLSPAEMFLQNAQAMVAIERKQVEHARAIADIGAAVTRVEQAQTILKHRPAGSEGITHIRPRINKLMGLSASTIDAVMRTVSYSPRVAGMVENSHVDALETTYAVYWQKDVTKCFRQFAGECTQVTASMWTHPQIEGRFKMRSSEMEGV